MTTCKQIICLNMTSDVQDLEPLAIIGFDGTISRGLRCHPDGVHVVYPIGNAVAIQNFKTRQQWFLKGHTNLVTSLAVSNQGKYIASGQINHMGFKAMVILWDFETRTQINKYEIHKVRVESIAFTADDSFLITLGGRDDTCIVVFNIANNEPMCGGYGNGSNTGNALLVSGTNRRGNCFLSAGDKTLRLWCIDTEKRKMCPTEVNFYKAKRIINCIAVDECDQVAWCGTTTGDICKILLGYPYKLEETEPKQTPKLVGCYAKFIGKRKMPNGCGAMCWSQGVTAILLLENGDLIVGAGDGLVEYVREKKKCYKDPAPPRVKDSSLPQLLVDERKHDAESGVTSLQLWGDVVLVGTILGEVLSVGLKHFDLKLLTTCHTTPIFSVCFPHDFSKVFSTCSKDTIRVWNTATTQELLRITVPNFTCSGVVFQYDGKGIVSSWNDGTIRAFTPQSGKLMYIIHNAHNKGVSALSISKDGKIIVSGGGEGQVRVWDIHPCCQKLKAVLQEHKGPVSAVDINNANDEAASSSTDGSCIIWDIVRCVRKNIIFGSTLFMKIRYHSSDAQILTAGTDRKITYWEAYDGSLIRDVEGSTAASVNAVDISPCGQYFASGGNDQIVKVWKYEEGVCTHTGLGHAGIITSLKFSSDSKYIASVSSDGGVFLWKNPYGPWLPEVQPVAPEIQSIRSEPVEVERVKSEECITTALKVRCKCRRPHCKCPKMKITTTKGCPCGSRRCQCKVSVIRPEARRTKSLSDQSRRTVKVASKDYGKDNIFGDYCPLSRKDKKN